MSDKTNGGPAFPRPTSGDLPDGNRQVEEQAGMTLRDWFAGQALTGVLAAESDSEGGGITYSPPEQFAGPAKTFATMAYGLADAMLAARKPRE